MHFRFDCRLMSVTGAGSLARRGYVTRRVRLRGCLPLSVAPMTEAIGSDVIGQLRGRSQLLSSCWCGCAVRSRGQGAGREEWGAGPKSGCNSYVQVEQKPMKGDQKFRSLMFQSSQNEQRSWHSPTSPAVSVQKFKKPPHSSSSIPRPSAATHPC